jgi:hypothetical protein
MNGEQERRTLIYELNDLCGDLPGLRAGRKPFWIFGVLAVGLSGFVNCVGLTLEGPPFPVYCRFPRPMTAKYGKCP